MHIKGQPNALTSTWRICFSEMRNEKWLFKVEASNSVQRFIMVLNRCTSKDSQMSSSPLDVFNLVWRTRFPVVVSCVCFILWCNTFVYVFCSGGLHIEVGGTNLNVVHHPKIVATVSGEEHIQYQAVSDGRGWEGRWVMDVALGWGGRGHMFQKNTSFWPNGYRCLATRPRVHGFKINS